MTFTALSIVQPYPWLILRPDIVGQEMRAAARQAGAIKDCENRDWETPVRGWVLLHASSRRLAKWDYQATAFAMARRGIDLPLRDNLVYGAVVGAIRVDECVSRSSSTWFGGPHAFMIGAAVPFAQPVECDGALRFFHLPPDGAGAGGLELLQQLGCAVIAAGLSAAFRLEEKNFAPLGLVVPPADDHNLL